MFNLLASIAMPTPETYVIAFVVLLGACWLQSMGVEVD